MVLFFMHYRFYFNILIFFTHFCSAQYKESCFIKVLIHKSKYKKIMKSALIRIGAFVEVKYSTRLHDHLACYARLFGSGYLNAAFLRDSITANSTVIYYAPYNLDSGDSSYFSNGGLNTSSISPIVPFIL